VIAVVKASEGLMELVPLKNVTDCLRKVCCEFAEMPGLHLSKPQAQRLWNLDSGTADTVLETLEASHYLKRTADNLFVRADLER
jgi:hypothetical protein